MATDIRDILSVARNALARSGVARPEDDPEYTLYAEILGRKAQTDSDAAARGELYRRLDDLYYPGGVSRGGADHWMNDPNLKVDDRVHVSLNTPPPYVDIPADLQAIVPYINAVPDSAKKADQEAADAREKLFWAWWDDCDMDLNFSFLSRIRSLYGVVSVRPYWDPALKKPQLLIVEAPENLRIGWGSNNFSRKDWALYYCTLSPQAVREDYGLDVQITKVAGQNLPLIGATRVNGSIDANTPPARLPTDYESTQVPVYDYWYKKPRESGGVSVWNAVYVVNHQVLNTVHPEYDDIPYVYIPNGKIPGRPEGRSELYDIEQIFREIDERFSDYGQMMHKSMTEPPLQIVGGDDYPGELSKSMMPGKNRPGMPGPGNHIEAVTPFLPAYQWGEYIKVLKDTLVERTGLSDLLLGITGSNVPGSSKAINAELAMYVPRKAQDREQLYAGIKELWDVIGKLWSRKDSKIDKILGGNTRLDIRAPEITVRDDVEQAQRTGILLQNGVISLRNAMDMNGIDNPSEQMDLIRAENTDAPLQPGKVMTLIQLMELAQRLGYASTQQAAQQGPAQVSLRDQALSAMKPGAAPPPGGSNAANQPGVTGTAENTPANALAPNGAPAAALTAQTMLQGGKTTGRVLSEQKL